MVSGMDWGWHGIKRGLLNDEHVAMDVAVLGMLHNGCFGMLLDDDNDPLGPSGKLGVVLA